MGFALLAMTWFAVRAGQPLERGLTIAYGVMALGSLAMSIWFLRARAASADRAVRAPRRLAARRSVSRHHRRGVAGPASAPDAGARGGDAAGHAARAACSAGSATSPRCSARRRRRAGRTWSWIGRSSPASPREKASCSWRARPTRSSWGRSGSCTRSAIRSSPRSPTTADFAAFAQPNHERLAMSIRAIPGDHGTLLALEHRTQPTDAAARRRFARYWLAIRPGGAFVTRQLLKAVARRAERGAAATESTHTFRTRRTPCSNENAGRLTNRSRRSPSPCATSWSARSEGQFGRWGGALLLDPAHLGRSSLEVWIDVASVDTGSAERDAHLRSPELLDVARFPRAEFRSTGVALRADGDAVVSGRLDLHGVTGHVELTVISQGTWARDEGRVAGGLPRARDVQPPGVRAPLEPGPRRRRHRRR